MPNFEKVIWNVSSHMNVFWGHSHRVFFHAWIHQRSFFHIQNAFYFRIPILGIMPETLALLANFFFFISSKTTYKGTNTINYPLSCLQQNLSSFALNIHKLQCSTALHWVWAPVSGATVLGVRSPRSKAGLTGLVTVQSTDQTQWNAEEREKLFLKTVKSIQDVQLLTCFTIASFSDLNIVNCLTSKFASILH